MIRNENAYASVAYGDTVLENSMKKKSDGKHMDVYYTTHANFLVSLITETLRDIATEIAVIEKKLFHRHLTTFWIGM